MNAIIPARGGSKGVPRKNIKYLCGKPLIAWTIQAAQKARCNVYVSTDDAEIAEVSRDYGAQIINRPNGISTDTSSSESAILHALENIEHTEVTLMLQCTSPFTTQHTIQDSIYYISEGIRDSCCSVTRTHKFLWDGSGQPINHNPASRERRQDFEQYTETGGVYAFNTRGFLENKSRFFGVYGWVYTSDPPLEIDSPDDFIMCEALMRQKQKFDFNPKILALDFDGVFTNNKVIVNEFGEESIICDKSDSMALKALDIPVIVITSEYNKSVGKRCNKLGLEYITAIDKWKALKDWLDFNELSSKDVLYCGNDINDIQCLENTYGVTPNDANEDIKPYARYVLKSNGGNGAIRELVKCILSQKSE